MVHRILIKLLLSYRLASDGTFGVVVVNGVPGEQLAQLAAGCLDGVCLALCTQFLELGCACSLVFHEALCEVAVLDVCQDSLHVFLDLGGDHAGAGDVVAVLCGVGDGPTLLSDATLDHQVNDELELVQDLEVSNLGLVACFGQNLEAVLNQLGGGAAEDCLLTEQVGFGLFGEGGLDDACAGCAEALCVGQCQCECFAGCVLLNCDQGGNAAACFEFAADGVAGALGGRPLPRRHPRVR